MSHRKISAAIATFAITVSACGGAAAPASPTAAQSAVASVAPTPTRPVVPATAQGATSTKLTENKLAVTEGSAPDLPTGSYLSTVSMVTLEKGGRTVAHKHGGVEAIYVLEGTVDFRTAAGARLMLTRGQGAVVPPGTALQAVNGGEVVAKFLAFFMTPETAAFQTNVDAAP